LLGSERILAVIGGGLKGLRFIMLDIPMFDYLKIESSSTVFLNKTWIIIILMFSIEIVNGLYVISSIAERNRRSVENSSYNLILAIRLRFYKTIFIPMVSAVLYCLEGENRSRDELSVVLSIVFFVVYIAIFANLLRSKDSKKTISVEFGKGMDSKYSAWRNVVTSLGYDILRVLIVYVLSFLFVLQVVCLIALDGYMVQNLVSKQKDLFLDSMYRTQYIGKYVTLLGLEVVLLYLVVSWSVEINLFVSWGVMAIIVIKMVVFYYVNIDRLVVLGCLKRHNEVLQAGKRKSQKDVGPRVGIKEKDEFDEEPMRSLTDESVV